MTIGITKLISRLLKHLTCKSQGISHHLRNNNRLQVRGKESLADILKKKFIKMLHDVRVLTAEILRLYIAHGNQP